MKKEEEEEGEEEIDVDSQTSKLDCDVTNYLKKN